jgi:RNase P subunit RPR2
MHKPIERTGPRCTKCSRPMTWHSVQEVHTREGELLMHVYECESCNRLAAFADPATAANK